MKLTVKEPLNQMELPKDMAEVVDTVRVKYTETMNSSLLEESNVENEITSWMFANLQEGNHCMQ